MTPASPAGPLAAEDLPRIQALLPACTAAADGGGGVPDTSLPEGLTRLMVAAACGREDLVETLLLQGADPARRDPAGHTAAAYARAAGHPHLAERIDTVVEKENTLR